MLCSNTIGQIALDLQVNREEYISYFETSDQIFFKSQEAFNKQFMKKNFDSLFEVLNKSGRFKVPYWNNTYFCFPEIIDPLTSDEYISQLIDFKLGVYTQPGEIFGMSGRLRFDKLTYWDDEMKEDFLLLAREV